MHTDTQTIQIQADAFLMLPIAVEIQASNEHTDAAIEEAIIEHLKEQAKSCAPRHDGEHIIIHCTYTHKGEVRKIKVLANGTRVPT